MTDLKADLQQLSAQSFYWNQVSDGLIGVRDQGDSLFVRNTRENSHAILGNDFIAAYKDLAHALIDRANDGAFKIADMSAAVVEVVQEYRKTEDDSADHLHNVFSPNRPTKF
ncbi:MAG: hypothetical protein ACRC20_02970 [Segniliparus sp.]|uniref:hypothetical protein n=1 Tax=Segniliparus sp. TaxID=2804064 RepID=UPI003F2FDFEF